MLPNNLKNRTIFCHDNLDVLHGINSECIDLIYLDPPFNKKKVFTAPIGSSAEGASFRDIFTKEDVKDEWLQTIQEDEDVVYQFLSGVKTIEGKKSYNFCYLCYMAIRLFEMRRILKETGSIYLHCDPTMSHYLKLLMDYIFGEKNFRNEIVWSYQGTGEAKKAFKRKHDIVFFYGKSPEIFFSNEGSSEEVSDFSQSKYNREDKQGKYKEIRHPDGKVHKQYLRQQQRRRDVWDIPIINAMAKERVGYPTQKPLALLEHIIKASSNLGDVVLDPFCGCATTCVAAEKLGRQWMGIDVSVKAYELVKQRLEREVKQEEASGQANLIDYQKAVNYTINPPKRSDRGENYRLQKYVYVMSNPQYEGEYKVGIASNLKSRLNSYQTASPDRNFKVEYEKLTPYFREIEKHIHEKFPNKHEWVQGNLNAIIDTIKNYQNN